MKKIVDVVLVVVVVVGIVVVVVGLFVTFSLWLDLDLQHVEITENLMVEVLPSEATE